MKPFIAVSDDKGLEFEYGKARLHLERLSDEHLDEALKQPGTGDEKSDEAVRDICRSLRTLPYEKRAGQLRLAITEMKRQVAENESKVTHTKMRVEDMKEKVAALDEFCKWRVYHDTKPPVIEKNDCSRLHKFLTACVDKRIITADAENDGPQETEKFARVIKNTFVVKHDWAAAFDKALGMDGPIRLPYDFCAFEFRISGKNVIAVAFDDPDNLNNQPQKFTAFGECGAYWYCFEDDENEGPILKYLWSQIRAICISLDAEVATSEVVRAPEKLNRKRVESGKLPLMDYHVVDLSKRHRVANPAPSGGTHKSPRLHFVRGHWRHLENAKVWIKWHLRGNPDLGFIQKEYAL